MLLQKPVHVFPTFEDRARWPLPNVPVCGSIVCNALRKARLLLQQHVGLRNRRDFPVLSDCRLPDKIQVRTFV